MVVSEGEHSMVLTLLQTTDQAAPSSSVNPASRPLLVSHVHCSITFGEEEKFDAKKFPPIKKCVQLPTLSSFNFHLRAPDGWLKLGMTNKMALLPIWLTWARLRSENCMSHVTNITVRLDYRVAAPLKRGRCHLKLRTFMRRMYESLGDFLNIFSAKADEYVPIYIVCSKAQSIPKLAIP